MTRPRAGPPELGVRVPAAVFELAAGRPLFAVWRNEAGGVTYRLGGDDDGHFVKWAPAGSELDLEGEAARMEWVRPFSVVPDVMATGEDEQGTWLVTRPLRGESAVSDRWTRQPALAVAAIGVGLRYLHDRAPVASCPFAWSVADRLERVRQRAAAGDNEPSRWHEMHQHLTFEDARSIVLDAPPVDQLVVCHGDACSPNTIIDNGVWSGHVDLGSLGVADRWADLAVAAWSTEWNYGPGWERALLDAYGIDPDPERSAYYRLLWDMA